MTCKITFFILILFAWSQQVNAQLDYGYGPNDAATVKIRKQVWTAKNLNVSTFANGDRIPVVKTKEEFEQASNNHLPSWWYYNNDSTNAGPFGKLYNWYAVHDPRGLAPKGWHIPSDEEWVKLIGYLGDPATSGNDLKSKTGWDKKGNGNSSSGLALPPGGYAGGYVLGVHKFVRMGDEGRWWSSTEIDTRDAVCLMLMAGSPKAWKLGQAKGFGQSVRCIKD